MVGTRLSESSRKLAVCLQGVESISDYAITFHYVSVEQLYNLDFYVYHLRPYGIVSGLQELNQPRDPVESPITRRSTPVTPSPLHRTVSRARRAGANSKPDSPPVL